RADGLPRPRGLPRAEEAVLVEGPGGHIDHRRDRPCAHRPGGHRRHRARLRGHGAGGTGGRGDRGIRGTQRAGHRRAQSVALRRRDRHGRRPRDRPRGRRRRGAGIRQRRERDPGARLRALLRVPRGSGAPGDRVRHTLRPAQARALVPARRRSHPRRDRRAALGRRPRRCLAGSSGMTTATARVFRLPDLGEGLTEAALVQWLVAVGDTISTDQAVAEVETAKSTVELPSPFSGVVTALHGSAGDTIAVGAPVLEIDVAEAASAPAQSPDAAADTTEKDAYRAEERAGSGNVLIGYGTTDRAGSGRRRARAAASSASVSRAATRPTAP